MVLTSTFQLVTSGARSAEPVLRGLVENSKYERPGPARPGTARHDTTRPRDAFDEFISLQAELRVRLTNCLL